MAEFPEHKPLFLELDNDELVQKPDEALFNKNWTFDNNRNKSSGEGNDNTSKNGQNQWVLTPVSSNVLIPNSQLPAGYNKSSAFGSVTTNEIYQFNYNENGDHGIYVIDGRTLVCQKVIIDLELQFSDDQDAFIANHRVILRAIYNENKEIIEKFLIFTDGYSWQKWIPVMAAIATDGFNVTTFPYWTLQQPHFDRGELLCYAVRPPMIALTSEFIDNTGGDAGKPNRLIGKSFRASFKFYYTDGRETPIAPWSLPFYVPQEDFLSSPDLLPKKALFTIYAGSCLVEKIEIYIKANESDWYRYDTINAYDDSDNALGTSYWLRTGKWANYSYDPVFNTIEYIFDNSKVGQIVDQAFITRPQNDIPFRSAAMSSLGDGILLGNNEIGFNNFSKDITSKFDVTVLQEASTACNVPLRNISVYAYVGLMGDHVDDITFISQVGYYDGEDTQMRFGGLQIQYNSLSFPIPELRAMVEQSKQFNLDFADRKSFRCYLKGTPYYADGVWYRVSSAGARIKIENDLDISDEGTKDFIFGVYQSQGYFICKFDFTVPAGVYTATLARHNTLNSEDWMGQSTYIIGIADSTLYTDELKYGFPLRRLLPNDEIAASALVSNEKEMEIDCRAADVDVWGNHADLFYVFAPSPLYEDGWPNDDIDHWTFIEGYLQERPTTSVSMELYPYIADEGYPEHLYGGIYTDKNGFFFQYSGRGDADEANVVFWGNKDCTYYDQAGSFFETDLVGEHRGWHPNQNLYWSNYNSDLVTDCNRIVITGRVENADGTLGYSNVSVSISFGGTATTNDNGEFTLIAHQGLSAAPTRYLYINAGGDFVITLADCTPLNRYNYTQPACVFTSICQLRSFVLSDVAVRIESGTLQSIKSEAKYPIGIIGADLAGRVSYVNLIKEVEVPSFMDLDAVGASYLHWTLSSDAIFTDDIKWVAFVVAKDRNKLKYVEWIGDNIKYLDGGGNETTDVAAAKLVQIDITSLLNANIASNFSLLANYQFVQGDRVRILDDGSGQLFDTSTYGDAIDLQIVGTTYNQAAANAGLINTIPNNSDSQIGASIIVEYSSRLDALKDKTGFWIELYSPQQVNAELPYFEAMWYPVVNNKIAIYTGSVSPMYTYPLAGDIDYWDTYLIRRNINIPNVGNKYFWHPFESSNVTDNWGKDVISAGRPNTVNHFAKRRWYTDHVIKSGNLVSEGSRNGLGTFSTDDKKDFKGFGRGAIVAIISQYSTILFICENDYFLTDYNFNYIYANAQGVSVANLTNGLSEPHQKVGDNYGCLYEHTGTIVSVDKYVFWYDAKNAYFIMCNYSQAIPISEKGIKSYLISKSVFTSRWNIDNDNDGRIDVIAGVDYQNMNVYLTFRPRRNKSLSARSFVNLRRDISIDHQETIVYNMNTQRWVRTVGFTPEAFISLRGNGSVQEMFTFANGKAYYHNNVADTVGYCNYYGIQTELVLKIAINDNPDLVKTLKTLAYQCLGMKLYCDLIYESQPNSFSYIPLNLFKTKKKVNYGAVLKDASSYPKDNKTWVSMLIDGTKKIFGQFFIVRIVGGFSDRGKYAEISSIFKRLTESGNNKK